MGNALKYTVRVTIEKEIEVTLPARFAEEEYLSEFRSSLWHIDGVDDVAEYAARMAAEMGSGYEHDGLGLLSHSYSKYPRVPDVMFDVISEGTDTVILAGATP